MIGDLDVAAAEAIGAEASDAAAEAQGWKRDKTGKWFAPARGRSGKVYRQGNETLEEAHARDAGARDKDKRPKKKPATPKAAAPTRLSSQDLEKQLTEFLEGPALVAAFKGDIWVADHITREAPILARNLVRASEFSPGLRAQLERALSGDSDFGKLLLTISIAQALAAYALPVLLYYLGDRAPAAVRETFGVPDKPKKEPEPPAPPAQPEPPTGAPPRFTAMPGGAAGATAS